LSKIPYRDLKILDEFLEMYWNDITAGGTFPPESKDLELAVTTSMRYIEELKKLYIECAMCGHMIAPDEKYHFDPASESIYCLNCLEEGL